MSPVARMQHDQGNLESFSRKSFFVSPCQDGFGSISQHYFCSQLSLQATPSPPVRAALRAAPAGGVGPLQERIASVHPTRPGPRNRSYESSPYETANSVGGMLASRRVSASVKKRERKSIADFCSENIENV